MSQRTDLNPVEFNTDGAAKPALMPAKISNRARGTCVEARKTNGEVEILLYAEIGYFGIMAEDFKAMLDDAAGAPIVVKINSPGGDVFEAAAMFNDLLAYKNTVRVEIVGLAASAASFVAMAADEISMPDNAMMMIHRAFTFAGGNSDYLHVIADMTADVDHIIAKLYARRATDKAKDDSYFYSLMDKESWLTAEEAVAEGLADEVTEAVRITAKFDLSMFTNAPKGLGLTAREADKSPTKTDLERALRETGLSRAEARNVLKAGRATLAEQDTAGKERLTAALQNLLKTATEGV